MLSKFAVTNYRGFAERIEWDLTDHANYAFNNEAIKNGVVKNGIIYGPNGSGKTNLGLAVFDIVNHLSDKMKKNDYYQNFIYAGNPDGVVSFEYTFVFEKQVVQYCYSKNGNGLLHDEALWVDRKLVFQHRGNELHIDAKLFKIDAKMTTLLANSANRVSIAKFLVTSFPLSADNFLMKLRKFVDGMLWFRTVSLPEAMGLENSPVFLEEFIIKNNLVADFERFLLEVSGQKFTFVKPAYDDRLLKCDINGRVVPFNMIISTGTHAVKLLYYWMQRMCNATFVFVDEFDAFYHYQLSFDVCKQLFALPCQLFTSTHNTHLMTNDLLRPDCYFILDKNKIMPLSKCTDKELREAHNIEKIYKAGGFYVE